MNIRFINKEKRTPDRLGTAYPEICLAAVQDDGSAIQYIDKDNLTPEVCLAAVKKKGMAIYLVFIF